MNAFSMRPDTRCQRGLHFVYHLPVMPDRALLESTLRDAFADRLVGSDEQWGKRAVRRLVLQFRFEVRLGARDHEISFLFRTTAPVAARAADQASFEQALTACVGQLP